LIVSFAELSVADILAEADISRGSFHFFSGKRDVLGELARSVIARGHEMASSWLGQRDETRPRCRQCRHARR
jgi:AcrR family transcriptional regulator